MAHHEDFRHMPSGQPRHVFDLKKIEAYASRMLSMREMARCMGVNPDTLYEEQKRNPEFKEAIERGRAVAVAIAAETVLKKTKTDYKAALAYLRQHGDLWNEKLVVEHQGELDVKVSGIPFDDATIERCAKAYLQLKGGKA